MDAPPASGPDAGTVGPSPAATSATGAVPAPPPSDAAPRPLAADELARARAELHAHYRARFGRLELRALAADASIDLDELAEPLDAMHVEASGAPAPTWHPISMAAGTSHFDVVGGDRPGVVRMLAQPAPLLTLLERPHARPCVVIGTAGSGKSLFLHRCAIAGSGGDRFLGIDRAIPVHVALAVARAAPQRSLADHAIASLRAAGLAIADAIDAEATAGRVVFLLDGLDEVGPAVQAVARAITALAATYPAARIVVTSRPAGLAGIDLAADHLQLEGLDDDAIGRLLARWCELDERRLAPDDPAAGERGKADGLRLAARVFATPHLHDLAACPLLATYLAVLHRAGAPLPDRRIELYDRIGQLVVARWNQVRPRAERGTPPIGSADVIRLLGPVAFAIVENGRGAVDEPELRALLARSISRGNIRGVTDVDDTLTTLRDALGLLVERAPGVYGLVHETLAELLAAHVAVRTRSLEALIRDPVRGFSATWYEVIRFALGILGTLQGDDLRLDAAVRLLVAEAHAARGEPSAIVPELLGSIGVDDPSLTPELAEAIAGELVPAWWFDGTPAFDGEHAGIALADRILTGPWARELAMAFIGRYRPGWGDRGPSGLRARLGPMGLLRKLGCPLPLLLCEALVAEMARGGPDAGEPDRFTPLLMITPDGDAAISYLRFAMRVSGLSALLREGCGRLFYAAMPAPAAGAADADVAADADGAAAAIDASWELLDDGAGTRMIGRRLDAPPPESLTITGPLHILVVERPDPAYLPRVLAAWRELAGRYPDGPRPPASLEEATDRYAALDEN